MSNIAIIDFETYFDTKAKYGLRTMTTEEYLRDRLYQTIGVAVKLAGGPAQWFAGSELEIGLWLQQFNLHEKAVIAHNAMFDMGILNWKFGIRPKLIIDIMSMARGYVGLDTSCSLLKLGEYFGLPMVKGDDTRWADGLMRQDFSPAQMAQYGRYCCNDVDMTWLLFQKLAPHVMDSEMKLIDWTIRCFSEPKLEIDGDLVDLEYRAFMARREPVRWG